MGFWGTLVAVRSNGDVPAPLRDRDAEERRHPGALRGDGWQVFEVSSNLLEEENRLSGLATDLGSPILAAYIADSDYGWLVGVSRAGRWCAWLDAKTAFAFERDHHVMLGVPKPEARRLARSMIRNFGVSPGRAARAAAQWATDAGYAGNPRRVRRILGARRPPGIGARLHLPWTRYAFAEDMFFDLLDGLGIPRSPGA